MQTTAAQDDDGVPSPPVGGHDVMGCGEIAWDLDPSSNRQMEEDIGCEVEFAWKSSNSKPVGERTWTDPCGEAQRICM